MTPTTLPIMLPKELRAIRAQLQLTQEEMAATLLVGLRQYKRYEAGKAPISRLRARRVRELAESPPRRIDTVSAARAIEKQERRERRRLRRESRGA